MFERYTERARRVLFFARYEVSQVGGSTLEPEHLLLGLLREGKGFTSDLFARAGLDFKSVRSEIQSRNAASEKVATSVEVPFSQAARLMLQSASAEAERLGHNYIGTEHLLLGMLCQPDTLAGQILVEKGIDLATVRQGVACLTRDRGSPE